MDPIGEYPDLPPDFVAEYRTTSHLRDFAPAPEGDFVAHYGDMYEGWFDD